MSQRLQIFTVFALAYILSYFFRSANAVIATDLARELELSAAQLGFMTGVFFISFAAVQLPLGTALDRFGARRVTPPLMLVAALGSALFAAAPTFPALVLGRALIGLGMAGVLMGALKTFGVWFSARRFTTVSGVFLGVGASGALGAATPLAHLNALVGWRTVFWGAAAVTLVSALLLALVSRDTPPHVKVAAQGQPGRLRDLFRNPHFWRLACVNFAVTGSMFAYQGLWAGPFLRSLGLPEVAASNLILLLSGGVVLGYFAVGWLGDRFGVGRVALVASGVFGAAQLTLAFCGPEWPLQVVQGLFLVFGLTGASSLLFLTHAQELFPHMTGRATTAVNLFGIGGGAFLQWGLGLVVGLFPDTALGNPSGTYSTLFVVTGVLVAAAALGYAPLRRRQPQKKVRPAA